MSRAAWLEGWFGQTIAAWKFDTAELREALGRLVFVYGALQYARPVLPPLFSFFALHPPGREHRLPVYALFVLRLLKDRIRARRAHPLHWHAYLKHAVLSVVAKAEGLAVAVGGWAPFHDERGCIVVESLVGSP